MNLTAQLMLMYLPGFSIIILGVLAWRKNRDNSKLFSLPPGLYPMRTFFSLVLSLLLCRLPIPIYTKEGLYKTYGYPIPIAVQDPKGMIFEMHLFWPIAIIISYALAWSIVHIIFYFRLKKQLQMQ